MKLSEMDTDRMFDCLAELTLPASSLMEDDDVGQAIVDIANDISGKRNAIGMIAVAARKLIPIALRKRRDETIEIIAILSGKKPQEIHSQKGMQTLRDAYDVWDKELLDFLKSFGNTAQKQ